MTNFTFIMTRLSACMLTSKGLIQSNQITVIKHTMLRRHFQIILLQDLLGTVWWQQHLTHMIESPFLVWITTGNKILDIVKID